MSHKHTIFDHAQPVQSSSNSIVEVHPSSDGTREQLAADVTKFRAEAEQKAMILSMLDYFFWCKGIEDSLELGCQLVYAKQKRTPQ